MKGAIEGLLLLLALGPAFAAEPAVSLEATNPPAAKRPNRAAEERRQCTKNLKTIFSAVEAFQLDHHDLPNWLSDLVPRYLPDPNVLICPVCRRTGETEPPQFADPKLPCSYLYEFCPVPLNPAKTNAPARTRREWKRRQMGLLGAQVPLVRCRHHRPVLNLSFDGKIYESAGQWELLFTNRVDAAALTAPKLFGDEPAPAAGKAPGKAGANRGYPARDPGAGKELLDLTRFYNAKFTAPGPGIRTNALTALPKGLQRFGEVQFDVRGLVRLRSANGPTNFPPQVKAIPVNQKCQKLHFLHAATSGVVEDGTVLGTYVIRYATNDWRIEIPIRYGREVRGVQPGAGGFTPSKELVVAWHSQSKNSNGPGGTARLFLTTWTNVAPGLLIEGIDFISTRAGPAPLLVAITLE